jgi:hypothetical protein
MDGPGTGLPVAFVSTLTVSRSLDILYIYPISPILRTITLALACMSRHIHFQPSTPTLLPICFTRTLRPHSRQTGQPLQSPYLLLAPMDHNGPEIILLACGILILVALLSVILWLGHRKRNDERRDSQESQRSYSSHSQGRECLFKEVFSDYPDHGSPLVALRDNDDPSFIATVRKRSQTIAGAVQHELRDLRRNLKNESQGGESRSLLDGDSGVGPLEESGTEEVTAHYHPEPEANARHEGNARRRQSSLMRQDGPKKRKSQEQSPTDPDKD